MMLFKGCKEIEEDIKSKISNYFQYSINDTNDAKTLISLLRSYLYELKIIKEIDSYRVDEINSRKFKIFFIKDSNEYHFSISMDLELRQLKIKKIISNNILD